MDAKDARKKSIDACANNIDGIVDRIKVACENGDSSISITGFLKGGVKIFLKENGYNIEEIKGNSFMITYIDWLN